MEALSLVKDLFVPINPNSPKSDHATPCYAKCPFKSHTSCQCPCPNNACCFVEVFKAPTWLWWTHYVQPCVRDTSKGHVPPWPLANVHMKQCPMPPYNVPTHDTYAFRLMNVMNHPFMVLSACHHWKLTLFDICHNVGLIVHAKLLSI